MAPRGDSRWLEVHSQLPKLRSYIEAAFEMKAKAVIPKLRKLSELGWAEPFAAPARSRSCTGAAMGPNGQHRLFKLESIRNLEWRFESGKWAHHRKKALGSRLSNCAMPEPPVFDSTGQ